MRGVGWGASFSSRLIVTDSGPWQLQVLVVGFSFLVVPHYCKSERIPTVEAANASAKDAQLNDAPC